jgi:hypothetical protein
MRMQLQRFLAMGALFSIVAIPACTVEVSSGSPGGAAGAGGSGGAAGTGGAKGDAATSEAGTSDGAPEDANAADATGSDILVADATLDASSPDASPDGTAPDVVTPSDAGDARTADSALDAAIADNATLDGAADASNGCFAEDQPDAGRSTTCSSLPYYNVACADDAGDSWPPPGASLCDTLAPQIKESAFQTLYACLAALPGADGGSDACSAAHEQASADCSRNLFNRTTCPVPDSTVEGGLYGCTQIAASCGPDSGAGGVPVELCRGWMGPYTAAIRQDIVDCYLDPDDFGSTSCRDKFENFCVFPEP